MNAFIYGLKHPLTQEVKYVGRTIQPLSLRLQQHIDKSRRQKSSSGKCVWIRSLLAQGLKPDIFGIESVPVDQSPQCEGKWIAYYKSIGANLLNETSHNVGGSRSYVVDWTDELIAKLGTMPDYLLAQELGIDRKSVEYKRTKLGIARCPQTNFVVPPMGGWNRKELPSSIIERLGTMPDYLLGKECGVSKKVIARERSTRNISPYAEQQGHPTRYKQGHRPTRWDKAEGR